jgi:hypothetical protein
MHVWAAVQPAVCPTTNLVTPPSSLPWLPPRCAGSQRIRSAQRSKDLRTVLYQQRSAGRPPGGLSAMPLAVIVDDRVDVSA